MSLMMNNMHSASSFLPLKPSSIAVHSPLWSTVSCHRNTRSGSSRSSGCLFTSPSSARRFPLSVSASTAPSDQETGGFEIDFGDFVEKDWSFLEDDETGRDGDFSSKIERIISAGEVAKTSKVLVSVGSESFVDKLVYSSPCEQLLVVHESLFTLAFVKEKHDNVDCWQGELINVPDKWTSFDVVYLYFLPAMPSELDQVLAVLATRCSPGARIVISHPQGREMVQEQKRQYPDIVVSDLPEKMHLESVAAKHSFELVEFIDEAMFYLSVLRFN